MKIEITFPVLNESLRIEKGVSEAVRFVSDNSLPISFVIADNGSTDDTFAKAEKLAKDNRGMIRLVKVSQRGVGLALKESWSSSKEDYVGYMDVDLATDLHHLHEVVEIFKRDAADLVTGSRLMPGSNVVGRKLIREISSVSFNMILRVYLGARFSDGMCGFKFLKRKTFDDVYSRCGAMTDGWFFNTEIMVKSQWLGYRLKEIPVKWTDDSDSRVKIASLAMRYLTEMRRVKQQRSDIRHSSPLSKMGF